MASSSISSQSLGPSLAWFRALRSMLVGAGRMAARTDWGRPLGHFGKVAGIGKGGRWAGDLAGRVSR